MSLPSVVFGFGAHSHLTERDELINLALLADRSDLDIFSVSDHPYIGSRIDADAALGFVLGRTHRLSGFANVASLPTRPVPMLARTITPCPRSRAAGRAGYECRRHLGPHR